MADDGILQMLMDMGFPEDNWSVAHLIIIDLTTDECVHFMNSRKALSETGNAGIDNALNWLLAHPDGVQEGHTLGTKDDHPESTEGAATITEDKETSDVPLKPLSLKCDDCGKRFKSELDAQAHAARTKHANFSESTEEIKPLTEEEKKAMLARLEAKKLQKRAEREEKEKQDTKEREKIRRKTGQELTMIKHEMEKKEAMKIAEQKRREKLEDKRAKEKVKEQIARDRAERAAREKAEKNAGGDIPTLTPPTNTTAVKKDYDSCRLQIRLFDGKTLVNSFSATNTLVDVNRYILMNRTDDNVPYSLMTPFPRRVFTADDTSKTLKDLGLTPSAVLTLTRQ